MHVLHRLHSVSKECIGHFSYKFEMTLSSGMLMKALHNGRMNEDIAVDSE
jgi:hypothetical protein